MTTINSTTTTEKPAPRVDDSTFDLYVELEADDVASPEQLAVLEADRPAWRGSLLRLLVDADEHLVARAGCRARSATRSSPTPNTCIAS